jgi:hypothetical protein
MRRVRKRVHGEGSKIHGLKAPNKRLSIEGVKPEDREEANGSDSKRRKTRKSIENGKVETRDPSSLAATDTGSSMPASDYEVQYIDVTEEVNRRLREARLRQLMDSPSTAQKRKRNTVEDVTPGDAEGEGETETELDLLRSPTKKLKASGGFDPLVKMKEGVKRQDINGDGDDRDDARGDVKRRKL